MRDAGPEMKVRQTPVYAASTLVSPDRKPAAAEKPRSMLKWDGKLKQWVKHEVLGQPQVGVPAIHDFLFHQSPATETSVPDLPFFLTW